MHGRRISVQHFTRVAAGLLLFFAAVAILSVVLSGGLLSERPAAAASFQPEQSDSLPAYKRISFLGEATPAATATVKPPSRPATFADFWNGKAGWVLETPDTGLPVGESDTINMGNGVFWSYLHASGQSAGVVDSCGDPAPFPGCVTRWVSTDGGQHFSLSEPKCVLTCNSCPCDADDLVDQQQYPRVVKTPGGMFYMVFENRAITWFTSSFDGITWERSIPIPGTGMWKLSDDTCGKAESIGPHPAFTSEHDCMAGGPPGLYITRTQIIVFVGLGQNPGHMGCFRAPLGGPYYFRRCAANPLFAGAPEYGPLDALGAAANPYFDFRFVTSADVVRSGSYYYMSYEGIRGPSSWAAGRDNQFALGFARNWALDGVWQKYPGNPVLDNVSDNWGIGHADLLIVSGNTYMYTGTPQMKRGRYTLAFK